MSAADDATVEPLEDDDATLEPDTEQDDEPLEDDDALEDDAEDAGPPPPPSSLTVTEERNKQMNAAAKTHETRLRTILGDDFAEYLPCPLCGGDAFMVATPPGVMPPEQWEAVQVASGQLKQANLKHAEYAEMCDTCDGWGQVLTGSKAEGQVAVPCRTCEGKGWKAKLETAPPVPTFTFPVPPANPNPLGLNLNGQKDQWGRPAGHPHFGIEPALVVA